MRSRLAPAASLTLVASTLPDIIAKEWLGAVPIWLLPGKLAILIAASILLAFGGDLKRLSKYTVVLSTIVVVQALTQSVATTPWWQSLFDTGSLAGGLGSSILLKLVGTVPVIAMLLFILASPREFYLSRGDLSVKAERVGWLGIDEDSISWGRLSVISAILISIGTLLLTMLTVTGFSLPDTAETLLRYFPMVVLFALVNSFSEGVVYRSAILGPLRTVLHKDEVLLIAAAFFGIAHYYGAPSGIVGVVMSGALGWYMCRSMYETEGFASSWIIHFMQDVVIFSTMGLLGGFA